MPVEAGKGDLAMNGLDGMNEMDKMDDLESFDVIFELGKGEDMDETDDGDEMMTFILLEDVQAAFDALLEVVERECDWRYVDMVRSVAEDIMEMLTGEWPDESDGEMEVV
jgi:hypothetical protein